MIPERNLKEASGLQDKQQSTSIADITDMMAEGPSVLLRLPKIRQSPEPMLWLAMTKMELEMLSLGKRNRAIQCRDESDPIRQEIERRIFEILMEVRQRMLIEGCAVNGLMDICSRILM
ncbi:hypothetical protein DPMN_048682 [Dreissena polymorpha]|uniref:Uncharacterized protein n=1 Tax=Dreissena polymorpha TaxID=45954 RepID=A0A9D4I348_DREPO|nr:hypothetical protein DPMN_048682 [Dreissena polymorpha]